MYKSLIITLLTAIIMTSCTSQAAKERQAIASLDSLFMSLYQIDEPGASILILKGDTILYDRGFGIADMKTGSKIDGNTFFNIASVSKQFSAIAILKLAEEGKLSLDDNVKKYFPEFKSELFKDITLRNLLSHTSGIGDDRPRYNRDFVLYATDVDSYSYMKDLTSLHFKPGQYYEYMNPTYQLFYTIIEKVSGKSFEQYMQDEIFYPAGMTSTIYFSPDKVIPNMSHGYIKNEKWDEYDYGEETFFATKADGGIYTSTHEFAKWEKALRSGTIVSDKTLKEAHSPHITVSDSPFSGYQKRPNTFYGYGWFIEQNPDFQKRIFHTGDNGGYQIYAGRYPESDLLLLIFENRNDYDRWENVLKVDSIMKKAGWL